MVKIKNDVKVVRAFEFVVIQNGEVVAKAFAADRATAERGALHYAMIYGQDGPAEVKEVK